MLTFEYMNIEARKISLAKKLFSIEKVALLVKLEAFFNQEVADTDWYDDLTTEQKEGVERARKQLATGQGIPNEEVQKRIRKLIESKAV